VQIKRIVGLSFWLGLLFCLPGCAQKPWWAKLGFASVQQTRGPQAVDRLAAALSSNDFEVAQRAADALVAIGTPAIDALGRAAKNGRRDAIWALGEIGGEKAAPPLLIALGTAKSDGSREAAAAALAKLGDGCDAHCLALLGAAAATDAEDDVQRASIKALSGLGRLTPAVRKSLAMAVSNGDFRVRKLARRALASLSLTARTAPKKKIQARPAPIVAVFSITDARGTLVSEKLDLLTKHLTAALTEHAGYRVIPSERMRARLAAEKIRSYKDCFDRSCQITLGKALAAQKTLLTRIVGRGGRCVLEAVRYDLRSETTDGAATVISDCDEAALLRAIAPLAKKLR